MTDTSSLPTSADFPPATYDDWRRRVDAVLKGEPFERLQSTTYDGLRLEPLYGRAAGARAVAGQHPGAAWTVMQRIDHPEAAAANAQALDDLNGGATGLVLVFAGSASANGYGLDPSAATLSCALDGVEMTAVAIELDFAPPSGHVVRDFAALVRSRGIAPSSVDLRAGIDPIGGFAASGCSAQSWEAVSQEFGATVGALAGDGFRGPLAVADGRLVHNAGGSEAQELAFVLASVVAYLRALEAAGMTLAAARDLIYLRLSADTDQFLTMAKFRAARKLYRRVEEACGLAPRPIAITAETAWRMMTRRDAHANMLRTAIAVAAAGFGGADAITVLPHTAPIGLPDAFARRIARNTQALFLEESNLARVSDPSAGSGAIEALTQQICTAAWSAFQEIEQAGGAWAAIEGRLIQQRVAAVRAKRQRAIAQRTDVLIGTNAFPNINEIAPAVLDITAPAPTTETMIESDPASTTPAALPHIRLAEPFEILRDASDRILAETGARPRIFLATLGTPAEFAARAAFARNYFEAGGIEAVGDGDGDHTPGGLAAAMTASGAVLACLCGSDGDYDREGVAGAAALKDAGVRHIYLAGRPGSREPMLRAAGVQTFIHDGCDVIAALSRAYDLIEHKPITGT